MTDDEPIVSDKSSTRADAESVASDEGVADDEPATGGSRGSREVEVPMRLYKTVTVFATLIAMVAVILGFVALDVATNRAQAAADEVNVVLAIVGLACIVLGAFVYAFSTRFRTRGMGKSKDESDEGSDNG